jgi:phosphate starvation-inducible PhoH-like protein
VKYLNDPSVKIVAGVGSAGTGKTLFACDTAIKMLHSGDQNVEKIILTRPLVSVENENIGFLPGDINSKMNPWLLPIFDIFLEYYTQNEINQKIEDGVIEISPLGYMRGRTFKNCIIIADEIQNATPGQLLMVATRIGLNSKLILTGDLNQSDLKMQNGLEHFVNKMKTVNTFNDIKLVEFSNTDVERSEVVKHVLKLLKD